MKLKPGDTVRVVGERGTSRIRSILTAVNGALLESQIGGYRNWNLDELRLVKRANGLNSKSQETRAKKLRTYWLKKKNLSHKSSGKNGDIG